MQTAITKWINKKKAAQQSPLECFYIYSFTTNEGRSPIKASFFFFFLYTFTNNRFGVWSMWWPWTWTVTKEWMMTPPHPSTNIPCTSFSMFVELLGDTKPPICDEFLCMFPRQTLTSIQCRTRQNISNSRQVDEKKLCLLLPRVHCPAKPLGREFGWVPFRHIWSEFTLPDCWHYILPVIRCHSCVLADVPSSTPLLWQPTSVELS